MTEERAAKERMPDHAASLFTDGVPGWETREGRWCLIEAILDNGNHQDIQWLVSRVGESELVEWLETRGGRRLNRRNRLFWAWLLDRPVPAAHPLTEQIWPL